MRVETEATFQTDRLASFGGTRAAVRVQMYCPPSFNGVPGSPTPKEPLTTAFGVGEDWD